MDDSMFTSTNAKNEHSNVEGSSIVTHDNEGSDYIVEASIPSNEEEDELNDNLNDENADMYKVDDEMDFKKIDFVSLSEAELKKYHFNSHYTALEFYNAYAQKRGFAVETGRWHVKALSDHHNHEMLEQQFVGMLFAHRQMDESELMQMNSMRDAGIGVTQIYVLAANQSGGMRGWHLESEICIMELINRGAC
ncbi:protein FAR1-RELATED SEQUENCE 5-like [Sesbania bispinosa]|nr:protein FAR1-RELATED SEQUENCE 5-like [Sesbania bispinosa]